MLVTEPIIWKIEEMSAIVLPCIFLLFMCFVPLTLQGHQNGTGMTRGCWGQVLRVGLAHDVQKAGASKMARRGSGGELWVLFHLCCSHTVRSHDCLSRGIQCKGFLSDLPTSTLRPTKLAPHSSLHGLCEAPIR